MPRSATAKAPPRLTSLEERCLSLQDLTQAAMQFTPGQRGEAMIRKWLDGLDETQLPEARILAMMADAVLLTGDLLLSQPSGSGSTAFDRLAKQQQRATGAEMAVINDLRQARFRLLQLESGAGAAHPVARDVVSGEVVTIAFPEIPLLPAGTPLFGRVVMLGEGFCCMAGAVTPLDEDGFAVARRHPSAGHPGLAAGARWAEAVYAHVVANGTLDVPGLNRPREGFDAEDDVVSSEVMALVDAWAQLNGAAPDADLLQRTRLFSDLGSLLEALGLAALARDMNQAIFAAFERMLSVQLETVVHRARSGAGRLTLDGVGAALERAIAEQGLPAGARGLFAALRLRLVGGRPASTAADPALERLLQRIQGLRAKTVERGCTEEEALAAAQKVAELLDRHGLSLSELDFRAQPCDGVGIQTNRRRLGPIDSCVPAIAAFFDCRTWVEQSRGEPLRYVFFGLRGDVAAAQYLYELVERAFETETDRFRAGPLYAAMAGERRSATNSFQIGLARGIADKLRGLAEARQASRTGATGRDLVPVKAAMVDEELGKLGLDLRSKAVGGRGKRVLQEAFSEGEAAGQRFEVTQGITEAA
jgi:hypothetical protein